VVGERYDPWQHARELELTVEIRPIADGDWGYYDHRRRRVAIRADLCEYERRCTLAHEIVHAERGDRCNLAELDELWVHVEAAYRLIPIAALAAAVVQWGEDQHRLGDELWVDRHTLQVRLEHLHPSERAVVRRALARREDVA
jgi:hypothetical protein